MKSDRERRLRARVPASGVVAISFEDPSPGSVKAELLDTSASGFRAAHSSKALLPGMDVTYAFAGASGRARVMWTQVLDQRRISGFLRLS